MLKKRLVGVVTVRNGWAVQSFGYRRYLPLGKPECLVENLDRWGADEILVQAIDRSSRSLGPDLELLERLARLGLETPLIYSGGVRNVSDGVSAIHAGADRLALDAVLHDECAVAGALADQLGSQALIAALPLAVQGGQLEWLDYRTREARPLSSGVLKLLEDRVVSEALLIDWTHEGQPAGFDPRIVDALDVAGIPKLAFGGLSEPGQIAAMLQRPDVAAVCVGHFLSYREHAFQAIKTRLPAAQLRPASYRDQFPLLIDD
jgi:cyclase